MSSSSSRATPSPAFMQQGPGLGNPENISLSRRWEGHSMAPTHSRAWAVLCQAQGWGPGAWGGAEVVTPSAPLVRSSVLVTAALGSMGEDPGAQGSPVSPGHTRRTTAELLRASG